MKQYDLSVGDICKFKPWGNQTVNGIVSKRSSTFIHNHKFIHVVYYDFMGKHVMRIYIEDGRMVQQ